MGQYRGSEAPMDRLDQMEADRQQRQDERDAYSRNRTAEIFASKGFKKNLKDQGLLGGKKGKEIKQGIKAAKSGNTISEFGAEKLERAMQLYGKRSGAHNGRDYDSNDQFSTMKKASSQFYDMMEPEPMQAMKKREKPKAKTPEEQSDEVSDSLKEDEQTIEDYENMPSPYAENDSNTASMSASDTNNSVYSRATPEKSNKAHSFLNDYKQYNFFDKKKQFE